MIKALVWDMGGVLVDTDDMAPHRQWEDRLDLAKGGLSEIVFNHPLASDLLLGKVALEPFWAAIATELNIEGEEVHELSEDFWKGAVWNEELISYIISLKGRYKLGVLSDAWPGTRESVENWVNYALFDVIMFSSEEGIRKPDPRFYMLMLQRLQAKPTEAVFIDDRPENVAGAEKVGLYGVHYTDTSSVQNAIREIVDCEAAIG